MTVTKRITFKGQKKTDTLDSKIRIEDGNGRLLVNDGTNNRIIIGLLPDGTFGLIISKEGYDVLSLFS